MFDFNITEVLNALNGMSIKEKLEKLDSIYAELDDAANEVLSARKNLEKEYEEQILQSLEHSIIQLSAEQHLEDVLHIKDDHSYEVVFDGHTYNLLFSEYDGKWYLVVNVVEPETQIYNDLLEKFANFCGLPFKKCNVGIELYIEESELFEKVKGIILSIKNQAN